MATIDGECGEVKLWANIFDDDVQTSNFGNNSFRLINTGDKKIASVEIDVTNALYGDSVFDPFGIAGDSIAKGIDFNFDNGTGVLDVTMDSYIGAGGTDGYKGIRIDFSLTDSGGFEPGNQLGFSIDMDPNSIAGSVKFPLDAGSSPPWDVGGVSGAELMSSTFTVTFEDGTTATGTLFGNDSQAGAQAVATQAPTTNPNLDLTVNGLVEGGVGTYDAAGPSIIVNGQAGETARIVLTKGFIQPVTNNFDEPFASQLDAQLADLAAQDFPANNAVEFQTVDILLDGTDQDISNLFDFSGVPIYDFEGEDQLPLGFIAAIIDTEDDNLAKGDVTDPIFLGFSETVNLPPSLDPVDDIAIDETGTASALITATDPEGNETVSLDLTLTDSSGAEVTGFTFIENGDGTGSFSWDTPNVAATEVFTATVTASDGVNSAITTSFDVMVNDVAASPPVVSLSATPDQASEADGTQITLTVTASNAVTGDQTVDLELMGTGLTAADFTAALPGSITIPDGMTEASIQVTVADDAEFEGEEIADFVISNPSAGVTLGLGDTAQVTINDNDSPPNEEPVLTSSVQFNVAETTTSVGQITATDAEDDPLTFTISGGADAALFEIDDATGDLSFVNAPDFEAPLDDGADNTYDVEVTVEDTQGGTDTAALQVDVTDVFESNVGAAKMFINRFGNDVQTSNFDNNSIIIENIGDKKIASVILDVTNALYPDSVFDPFGIAGDMIAKGIDINNDGGTGVLEATDDSYIGEGGTAGFEGIELLFSSDIDDGFGGGDILSFSIDMDPNSIAGSEKFTLDSGSSPDWDVGGVSGAELIGSTFTVTFEDGTTASGQLHGNDTQGGSHGLATQDAPDLGPLSVTVNGLGSGEIGTYDALGASVIVNGPAGETARIVLTKGFIQPVINNFDGPFAAQLDDQLEALAAQDFPANNAVEFQTVDILLDGTDQDISDLFNLASVAEFSFPGDAQLPLGIVGGLIDPDNEDLPISSVTSPIYLEYDPSQDPEDALTVFLVNTETDAIVAQLTDNISLNATDLEDVPLAVYAQASPNGGLTEPIGSVKLDFQFGTFTRTESAAPYALFGDANGDFFGGVELDAGDYRVDFEIFSGAGGSGDLLEEFGLTFTLADGPVNQPPIAGDDMGTLFEDDALLLADALTNDTDPEGDLPLSLVSGSALNGVVSIFDNTIDYVPNRDFNGPDTITYIVADALGATSEGTIDITVLPVNDTPVAQDDNISVQADGNVLIDVLANDSDVDLDDLTITDLGTASGGMVSILDGEVVYQANPGFVGMDSFTYDISDGVETVTATVNVNVTLGNQPPNITSASEISIEENTPAILSVTAEDPEDDDITFAIDGGDDANLFAIDADTGALSFINAPDFEEPADQGEDNIFNLTVSASDGSDVTTQDLTVTVTDDPDESSPEDLNIFLLDSDSDEIVATLTDGVSINIEDLTERELTIYAEAVSGGTLDGLIGSVRLDFDNGQVVRTESAAPYALFGDNGSNFFGGLSLDDGTYQIDFDVFSGGGGSGNLIATKSITFGLNDTIIPNSPPVLSGLTEFETLENTVAVGSFSASDVDGDMLSYALSGTDAALFEIDDAGVLVFNTAPDFELPADDNTDNIYDLLVSVSDGRGGSDSLAITVEVTDDPTEVPNSDPVISGPSTAQINENSLSVATYSAIDPDMDSFNFSIAGGADAALFEINALGELSFVAAPNFEAPADAGGDNIYDVVVGVTDVRGGSDTQSVEVTVADVVDEGSQALDVFLVNTATDEIVTQITDGLDIAFSSFDGAPVAIYAEVAGGSPLDGLVGSALIDFNDGEFTRTENAAPYALFGDSGGNFFGDAGLTVGNFDVEFELYSGVRGSGDLLETVLLNFDIV